jgi:hypothetical protein
MRTRPNTCVERTGTSRLAQSQFEGQWRLVPEVPAKPAAPGSCFAAVTFAQAPGGPLTTAITLTGFTRSAGPKLPKSTCLLGNRRLAALRRLPGPQMCVKASARHRQASKVTAEQSGPAEPLVYVSLSLFNFK